MKTHYELLGLEPAADADTIKKAFRREIARYHPDKVIHLGAEFQEMAATRAAELTVGVQDADRSGRCAPSTTPSSQAAAGAAAVAPDRRAPAAGADRSVRHRGRPRPTTETPPSGARRPL